MNFKDNFTTAGQIMEYADSTYTIKTHVSFNKYLKSIFFKYAPTANITQVSFRNGRATYTKLKEQL